MERLLDYFTPENYQLTLNINKATERVRGKVVITGTPHAAAVKFHAKDLKIISVESSGHRLPFTFADDTLAVELGASSAGRSNKAGNSILGGVRSAAARGAGASARGDGPDEPVAKDTVAASSLTITYSFQLNRNMEGAYLSTYQHDGHEEKIVTTQFESHYARQCFPCIDEPAAKATFDLKIISHDPEDTIISNMPAKSERIRDVPTFDLERAELDTQHTNQQKVVEFETTPRMSTYLVAFALGHFHSKTTETARGVTVTTYCALNQDPALLDFPNQIAAETLDYYDQLFDMPYPLPKLDQLAVPDFEAGAMENWGLVTYREVCLLAGDTTPQSTKEYIATVITHELSHQWFGNLVTMQWWDDLWLNESFANIMQYLSVDALHPDWHILEDFFTGDCYAALRRDALPGVQAVKQPVEHPAEIATLFDGAIVYAKGARLIFMLYRLMGHDQFFAGIRDYFQRHQYQNTTGDDLWAALQPHADFDVKTFMDAWVSQPGYPVVTDLVQQRFLITGATDDTKWPLPQVTDDMSGHYLLNLTGPEFDAKLDHFAELNLEQRLRLLIDRELLSRTPLVSSASLLDLLPKFRDETSEPVWEMLATIINTLKIFCPPESEFYQPYQRFVLQVIQPQLQRLGTEPRDGEDPADTKLRKLILGLALYAEHQSTIKQLAGKFNPDYAAIHPEVRSAVILAQFKHSDEANFQQLLNDYQAIANPSIKPALLATLTEAKQPQHTQRLLQLLEQPDIVRPQDHIYLVADLLYNIYTRDATFDWLYGHWDYIRQLAGDKSVDDYVRIAAARIRTLDEAERFFEFFGQFADDPALARSIAVARTDINARLRWLKDDADAVHSRLQKA